MGIQGLLPTLKSITSPRHVRDYAGKRAAVDTYSWLHKAAFSCSKDICLGRPNDKYLEYCMHRVNMLRHFGVQPVLVFDGGSLPMKSDQEIKRARSRKENLDRALEHERSGNTSAAYECFQRAVDITPAIAFRLIKVLRQENVDYVVAPYEADAQMAFLSRNGHVDLVITEDSDLIAYGCPQILFKMDKYGQGMGFQYSDIPSNKDLDFNNFSKQMILEMCIMSGCDYLSSLPGMGVKRAHGLIKRFKTYSKVIKHLKFSGVLIDKEYEQGFQRAILTFQHHRVYDPVKREMVHLTELPSGLDIELDFLGPYVPQTVATAIAIGEVDPTTYEPFEDICSSKTPSAAPKASVHRGSPIVEVGKTLLITKFFQGPGEPAKKLFKPPRNAPEIASSHPSGSQEEMASQVTPSLILSSQTYSSPFSRFAFTSQQSPVYTTPPSQVSPFVREDLDLDEDSLRIIDLTSEYPPPERPLERVHIFSDEKQRDELPTPFPIDSPSPVKAKISKTSVPLLQVAAAQLTSAKQLRVQATCPGVKRSEYFSQSSPSPLPRTSPNVSPEVDAVNKSGDSPPDILLDTQNSEAADIEYESLRFNDMPSCSDANKEILKDVTNNKTAATGKRKHAPHFQSDLLGKRPIKSRSFSSVSHVGQYAGLAQRSMDDFVSTLAPFRCSQSDPSRASGSQSAPSKQGTRASGLRAPSKSAHKASVSRALTKKIIDFTHTSRRLSLPESTAAAGALRWQVYNEDDWERAKFMYTSLLLETDSFMGNICLILSEAYAAQVETLTTNNGALNVLIMHTIHSNN